MWSAYIDRDRVPQTDATVEIALRIETFKTCLITHGVERALTDYVLTHGCSILGADVEVTLREAIAARFEIDPSCVTLVGSAKLGFSPKPGQYFKHFSGASDLDVAIVSKALFSRVWKEVFEMERAGEHFDFREFKHYHFRGWIRPDMLPSSREYETCRHWWEFFQALSREETYQRLKVRAGLYFDDYFLRNYQLGGLLAMREHLMMKGHT